MWSPKGESSMGASDLRPVPKRPLTPLWVISLFVSLTETVLGVAATQTSGGVQVTLIVFVVAFPLLIAAGFFAMLWFKPHHIYAPTEYGSQVSAREYMDAITQTQRKPLDEDQLYANIQKTIHSTITSNEIVAELTEAVSRKADQQREEEITRILDAAANRAIETITEESFLTIDSRPLLGENGDIWRVPYDRFANISSLLNSIYFALKTHVPVFSYGDRWILQDANSGQVFMDMGKRWAEKNGMAWDERSLKAVGIMPGAKLDVIPVNNP
jgi:hypothetical protein